MPSLYAIEVEYPDSDLVGWVTNDNRVDFVTPNFFSAQHAAYVFDVYGGIINRAASSPSFQVGHIPSDMARIISVADNGTKTYIAALYRYDFRTLGTPNVTVINKYRVQITIDDAKGKWEVTDLSLPAGRKIN